MACSCVSKYTYFVVTIRLSNTFDNDIEVRDAFGNYWNYYDGLHTLPYQCDLED